MFARLLLALIVGDSPKTVSYTTHDNVLLLCHHSPLKGYNAYGSSAPHISSIVVDVVADQSRTAPYEVLCITHRADKAHTSRLPHTVQKRFSSS